jgi:hypothetical protein
LRGAWSAVVKDFEAKAVQSSIRRWVSGRTVRRRAFALVRGGAVVAGAVTCALALTAARGGVPSATTGLSLAFGGRIIPADGGTLDGVRVTATDARGSYEALVDPSGVFVGAFPAAPAGRVTLRVFSDSATPRYHTSVVSLGPGVPSAPARILIVPRRWVIRGGSFARREVSIDPIRAASRTGDGAGFWRLTGRGRLAGRVVSWIPDSLPVRVAFRHERGDPAISMSDSLAFWTMASELERRLGASLFRPASFDEVDAGADGILVTVDRRMSAAGKTYITYDPSGRIYEALVTVGQREYLGQPRIAMHELMHAIGFGHTNGWPSVMGPSAHGIDVPSAEDVAYAQLYYAISALQRAREAPFGILEVGPLD